MTTYRRSKRSPSDEDIHRLLNHIHSLGIASRDQVGGWQADTLMRQGLIRQVWIGSYALTEKGKRARKSDGTSSERGG